MIITIWVCVGVELGIIYRELAFIVMELDEIFREEV